jgi:hypothetical protein
LITRNWESLFVLLNAFHNLGGTLCGPFSELTPRANEAEEDGMLLISVKEEILVRLLLRGNAEIGF